MGGADSGGGPLTALYASAGARPNCSNVWGGGAGVGSGRESNDGSHSWQISPLSALAEKVWTASSPVTPRCHLPPAGDAVPSALALARPCCDSLESARPDAGMFSFAGGQAAQLHMQELSLLKK